MDSGPQGQIGGGEKADLLARLLAAEGLDAAASAPIPPRNSGATAPASFAQELLWLLDRSAPGLVAYNVLITRRLLGALDIPALNRAFDMIMERHEILRTTYESRDDQAIQRVRLPRAVNVRVEDIGALPSAEREASARRLVAAAARTPFDLGADQLLRARLIRLGDGEHLLAIVSHHIVFDGWSQNVMFGELSALYNAIRQGRTPALAPLAIQYADYAAWERDPRRAGAADVQLAYWRERLAGAVPLALPTDRLLPAVPSFEGARESVLLGGALPGRLRALAQARGVTVYMVLLAAYQAVLARYTGQDDILVGSPVAGRMRAELEGLIGYFANTLPLRTELGGNPTFGELLQRVKATCLGAFEHQDVPFESLNLEAQAGRTGPRHATLIRAVLTMGDGQPSPLALDGLTVTGAATNAGWAKFDLTLFATERPDGVYLTLQYRTDLFASRTASRFLANFHTLLAHAIAEPDRPLAGLSVVSPGEGDLLAEYNRTAVSWPAKTRLETFVAAHAARGAPRLAVICGAQSLTYAELDQKANALAGRLRAAGVTAEMPVGLCLDRSAEMVVAMVGVWRAGGAYVPLPPELPEVRLAQQIAAAGVTIVVTRDADCGHIPGGLRIVSIDEEASDADEAGAFAIRSPMLLDQVAYVLFTSGSTGEPKGVAVTHENVMNYTRAMARELTIDLEADPRVLHFASVSTLAADLGNTAIFLSLASGGTLHLIPESVATDASAYGDYVASRPIDVLKITPGHLGALLAGPHGAGILPARQLILGGEACSWALLDRIAESGRCQVINHYGPTETTIGACTFDVQRRAPDVREWQPATLPIGRPLANVTAYVLDAQRRLVPIGVAGELYIGGAGVARGYIGRPDLTAERFVRDPFAAAPGGRLYRTGDRVRRLTTGDLEFLGRYDDQVKLRGYRVELGEIEHALRTAPGVRDAVALLDAGREDEGGTSARLLAAVVAPAETEPRELATFIAGRLPAYMVPSEIITLTELPRTPNGKVDRAAVAALFGDSAASASVEANEPATPTEAVVAQIWSEVLKATKPIARIDNFFGLGGHSLSAIRVLGRLSKTFGVRLPLRVLFEQPTVAALAACIDAESVTAPSARPSAPTIAAVPRGAYRQPAAPRRDPREPAG